MLFRSIIARRLAVFASIVVCLVTLDGCVRKIKRQSLLPDQTANLNQDSPFLKAHMRNGEAYVLTKWYVNERSRIVSGIGERFGINRQLLEQGEFLIPVDSVALFETNVLVSSPTVAAMALITGASIGMTIYCISNPKACFGSCPTFFAWDGNRQLLQAEGFSTSVAPSLEATDIDALYRAVPQSNDFRLTMTNEALETHVVRRVDLLAAEHSPGNRVLHDMKGLFWEVANLTPPASCSASEGDCLTGVESFDGDERFSGVDSTDLATKEIIDLAFEDISEGDRAVAIAARQTLLSTYLFYQSLAYLGTRAGDFLSTLEKQDEVARVQAGGVGKCLGGIEVIVQLADGSWHAVGSYNETGPLATDFRMVTIPDTLDLTGRVRLSLTKGHWRLDYVAMGNVVRQVHPARLQPAVVWRSGEEDNDALACLKDPDRFVVTFPGDTCVFKYELPDDYVSYDLFLESRGYYLEWMRDEWLAEENLFQATQMLLAPDQALRNLAPAFKALEDEMEQCFWNSRYVK